MKKLNWYLLPVGNESCIIRKHLGAKFHKENFTSVGEYLLLKKQHLGGIAYNFSELDIIRWKCNTT